jgi:hypothetical protein
MGMAMSLMVGIEARVRRRMRGWAWWEKIDGGGGDAAQIRRWSEAMAQRHSQKEEAEQSFSLGNSR